MAIVTVSDIITGAFRKLSLIPGNAEPSAEEMAQGLVCLNDMCNSWSAKDVHSGFSTVTDVESEFVLDERHHGAVKAMLAEYMAAEFGEDLPPPIKKQAYDGWLAIKADYRPIETLQVDRSLQRMPSQRIYW